MVSSELLPHSKKRWLTQNAMQGQAPPQYEEQVVGAWDDAGLPVSSVQGDSSQAEPSQAQSAQLDNVWDESALTADDQSSDAAVSPAQDLDEALSSTGQHSAPAAASASGQTTSPQVWDSC